MQLVSYQRAQPTIQVTPLIDVLFILLVFVILAASFARTYAIVVTPPEAETAAVSDPTAAQVIMATDGRMMVDGVAVTMADLAARLRELRTAHDALLIRADGQVALERAVRVLDAARIAGFPTVSMATRAQQDIEPAPAVAPESDGLRRQP